MYENSYDLGNLAWGMELEGYIKASLRTRTEDVARADYAARLQKHLGQPVCFTPETHEWHSQQWVVTNDWTIQSGQLDIEIKSPISYTQDVELLPERLEKISQSQLKANDNSAMHFHMSPLASLNRPGCKPVQYWSGNQTACFIENFQNNIDEMEDVLGEHLFDKTRAPRNPWVNTQTLYAIAERDSDHDVFIRQKCLSDMAELVCPLIITSQDGKPPTPAQVLKQRRKFQNNMMSMLPVNETDGGKGTFEPRLMAAKNYRKASPFIRTLLAMGACSIRGREFTLADYAASIAHDKRFALPKRRKLIAGARLLTAAA